MKDTCDEGVVLSFKAWLPGLYFLTGKPVKAWKQPTYGGP